MKSIRCLFNVHRWLYWRMDAHYRYCTRCKQWQFLDINFESGSFEWMDCDSKEKDKNVD